MKEFYDNQDFPWTQKLEANWKKVRAELDGLAGEDFSQWPRSEMFKTDWNLYLFFAPGWRFEEHCERCPETTKLVDSIPGVKMATFTWLKPDSHILPHEGFTSMVLRAHLALRVPDGDCALRIGSSVRPWEEGKVMVFDDMNEHEAWNRGKEHRVVLMIDFLRPFKHRTSTLGYLRHRVAPHPDYKEAYDRAIQEAFVKK